jgi:hypothetical protein
MIAAIFGQTVACRGNRRSDGRALRSVASVSAFLAVVMTLSLASAAPPKAGGEAGGEWKIAIRPSQDSTAAVAGASASVASQPGPDAPVAAASGISVPRMTYAEALAAIPFNRAEYEANPGYRHDAAMELMFGVMRPTTVVRQNIPYFSRYPDFFRNRFQIYPYPSSQNPAVNMFSNWTMNSYSY